MPELWHASEPQHNSLSIEQVMRAARKAAAASVLAALVRAKQGQVKRRVGRKSSRDAAGTQAAWHVLLPIGANLETKHRDKDNLEERPNA